ncbi:hypothetical protein AACK17_00805 [Pectobacterium punjabense]|uniref:phage tail fiber protein n=1 Tax=Pectobacterium punjabense TaxID=2108399 RepID=UPI00311E661D
MSEITPNDLPPINELDEFTAKIPELQIDTDVLAGPAGPANFQAQALANRTRYLKRIADAAMKKGEFGVGGILDLRGSPLIGMPSAIYGKGTVFGFCEGAAIGLPEYTFVTLMLNGSWENVTGIAAISRVAIANGVVLVQQALPNDTWSDWGGGWNSINLANPMQKGEFGIGGRATSITNANHETFFNSLTPSGWYSISGSPEITLLPTADMLIEWRTTILSDGRVFGVLIASSYFGQDIGHTYTRIYSSSGWGEWLTNWDNKIAEVFGLGVKQARHLPDYKNMPGGGFYRSAPETIDSPPDTSLYMAVINASYANDNTGTIAINVLNGTMWHTGLANGAKRAWRKVYDTGNTTVASGGALLAASPVINIFSDGSFTANDEAAGVNVERLSEGVYKITGCQGMNADPAWNGIDGGVKNPVCRNDKALLWNNYEVHEDGSITVYTFHRVHPDAMQFAQNQLTLDKQPFDPKKGHRLEDTWPDQTPIDVPRGAFIQVRVNMPERIESKPTVMHSNVYCNSVSPAK